MSKTIPPDYQGRCDFCAAGVREHCSNRTVLGIRERGGAFAEYVSLPS